MTAERDVDQFARLIAALGPWLDQVAVIGGWAHRLYRFHDLAQALEYSPLTTLDTDVALPARVPVEEQDIRDRLLANGFEEELLGDHTPPVTHYSLGTNDSGFYVEFLTPLVGSVHGRDKKSAATVRVGGVTTQRLRHLDLLLHAPWSVKIDESDGFPLANPMTVRIPSATAYIAQKVLVRQKRNAEERAKDLLYIHDTIELFGRSLPSLSEEWRNTFRQQLHAKAVRTIERAGSVIFGHVDDISREAALMAMGRRLSADEILEVCRTGWKQIFE
jgi:hypothetical protein